MGKQQKYAFLDRDGTIIWEPEKPESVDPRETFPLKGPDEVRFMEGAIDGMDALTKKNYALALVTNQTFLGTPKHPKGIFDAVMKRLTEKLEEHDIRFSFVMVCPHGPDEGCECRKPKIGGVQPLLEMGVVDLAHSVMFGDRDTDGEFAKNFGVRFVSIETNKKFVVPPDLL